MLMPAIVGWLIQYRRSLFGVLYKRKVVGGFKAYTSPSPHTLDMRTRIARPTITSPSLFFGGRVGGGVEQLGIFHPRAVALCGRCDIIASNGTLQNSGKGSRNMPWDKFHLATRV